MGGVEAEQTRAAKVQDALYRIAELASAAQDMQEFYRAIHEVVGELMPAKNFFIALYDEQRQLINWPYWADEVDDDWPDANEWVEFGSGQAGVTGYALRTGEPELISYDREPVSLDQTVGEDGESALGDFVARVDPNEEPGDSVSNGMLRDEVEIVLSTLSQREQAVIRLRFGLDDGRQRTLDEVGREFGLSRERIRQIEKVTLLKLRHPSRAKRLEAYAC